MMMTRENSTGTGGGWRVTESDKVAQSREKYVDILNAKSSTFRLHFVIIDGILG